MANTGAFFSLRLEPHRLPQSKESFMMSFVRAQVLSHSVKLNSLKTRHVPKSSTCQKIHRERNVSPNCGIVQIWYVCKYVCMHVCMREQWPFNCCMQSTAQDLAVPPLSLPKLSAGPARSPSRFRLGEVLGVQEQA